MKTFLKLVVVVLFCLPFAMGISALGVLLQEEQMMKVTWNLINWGMGG